jgi:hypothetical protein
MFHVYGLSQSIQQKTFSSFNEHNFQQIGVHSLCTVLTADKKRIERLEEEETTELKMKRRRERQ